MTNVGFWFLFGGAFISAAVISLVCFLEVSFQLGRRSHKRAPATSLSGFQIAGAAREILLRPRKAADGFREQIRGACVEAAVKIARASAASVFHYKHVKQAAPNTLQHHTSSVSGAY